MGGFTSLGKEALFRQEQLNLGWVLRGRERRVRIPFYFPLRSTVDGRLDSLLVLGSRLSTLLEMIRG